MNTKLIKCLAGVIVASLLVACAGKKQAEEEVSQAGPQADITRPPVFVKRVEKNTETNPEETVSFDKWSKEQKAQ